MQVWLDKDKITLTTLHFHDLIFWNINKMSGYTIVNLHWKRLKYKKNKIYIPEQVWFDNDEKTLYLPIFFIKIMAKSRYSKYHILWKIMKMRGYNIVNQDFFEVVLVRNTPTAPHPPTHPKTDIFFIFCEFKFQLKKNKGNPLEFLTHKLFSKIIIKNSPLKYW